MKPVLHRVFVRPEAVEEVDDVIRRAKAAGIAVELDKREKQAVVIGTVVEVGLTAFKEFGASAEQLGVHPGARVMYAKYSGAQIPNTDLIILNDEDIVAVL